MIRTPEWPATTPALSRRWLLAGLGASLLPVWPLGVAAAEDGLALARRVHERPDGQDVTSVVTMLLGEEGKQNRVRKMLVYRSNGEKGEKGEKGDDAVPGYTASPDASFERKRVAGEAAASARRAAQ